MRAARVVPHWQSTAFLLLLFATSLGIQPAWSLTTKRWIGIGSAPLVTANNFNLGTNWSPAGTPGPSDSCVIIAVPSAVSADPLILITGDITVGALAAIDSAVGRVLRVDSQTNRLTVLGTLIGEAHGATPTTQCQFSVGVAAMSGGTIDVGGDAIFGVNGLQQTFLRGITTSTNSQFIFRGNVTFGIMGVTSGSNFPSKYVFDAPGTQTISVNPPADQPLLETVGLSAVEIGGTNAPTVILGGTGEPFLSSAATYSLTVKANSTLDLRAHTLNRTAAGASFTLAAGARLVLGGSTGGQTGSNFPLNYTTSTLNPTSTVEYNSGNGVNQTIFATPAYGNLTLSNSSGIGATVKTAGGALTVAGNLTIGSNATFAAGTNLTHNVAGNWTNNGGFTFTTGSTIKFNTAGSRTISGSSTTGFDKITLDKVSASSVLEILSPITMTAATAAPTLTLTNGTFKLSSGSTITPFGGNVTLGATAGYFLNAPGATSNWGNAGDLTVNGALTVAAGTMNVGTGGNKLLIGSTGSVAVSGGTLNARGRLQATTAGGSLSVSAGTLAIPAGGTINTAANSIVEVSNAIFSMSGGTLSVASPNGNTTLRDINITQSGTPITGGRILITSGSSPVIITLASNVPLFDLMVQNGAAAATARSSSDLTVANDLTIASGTLDAPSSSLHVRGNWSNGGTFVSGTNLVYFDGSAPQTIGGAVATTFTNLVISNASGVTLGASAEVRGYLILVAGSFGIGANVLTLHGAITGTPTNLVAGPTSSLVIAESEDPPPGPGIFLPTSVAALQNLTVQRLGSDALHLNANLAVGGTLTLTDGEIATGSNALALGPAGSVTRTNGWVIGNLRKPVAGGAGTSLTFEIGSAGGYTPVDLAFGIVTTAGDLTATTVASDHPSLGGSGLDVGKLLHRHYVLTNAGVAFDQYGATFTFLPADADPAADPSKFVVRKYDEPNWSATTVGTRTPTSVQATGITTFSDFAIGEPIGYTITTTAGLNGSINPSGAVPVGNGSSQTFTITPDAGHHVLDVLVDGNSVGAVTSYTFTNVVADHTIAASFAINTYTINASAGPHGIIAPAGAVVVTYGQDQMFTITPDPGYAVANVQVDDDLVGPVTTYTFNGVAANHLIAATFVDASLPVVSVLFPNGGETLMLDSSVELQWTAADNVGVASVDLLLSRTGSGGPFEDLALAQPNTGSYAWTVSGAVTEDAFLKVAARDSAGNIGLDLSDAAFRIASSTGVGGPPITEFALGAVRPNPILGLARISYALPREAHVRLSVLDVQGREVATLMNGVQGAGRYEAHWSPGSGGGSAGPGVYFLRLEVPGRHFTRRVVVVGN